MSNFSKQNLNSTDLYYSLPHLYQGVWEANKRKYTFITSNLRFFMTILNKTGKSIVKSRVVSDDVKNENSFRQNENVCQFVPVLFNVSSRPIRPAGSSPDSEHDNNKITAETTDRSYILCI